MSILNTKIENNQDQSTLIVESFLCSDPKSDIVTYQKLIFKDENQTQENESYKISINSLNSHNKDYRGHYDCKRLIKKNMFIL